MPVADNVVEYAVKLAAKTRPGREHAPDQVNQYLSWGAGPRASQYLIIAAKCHAAFEGKYSPDIDNVRAVALPICSPHRPQLQSGSRRHHRRAPRRGVGPISPCGPRSLHHKHVHGRPRVAGVCVRWRVDDGLVLIEARVEQNGHPDLAWNAPDEGVISGVSIGID